MRVPIQPKTKKERIVTAANASHRLLMLGCPGNTVSGKSVEATRFEELAEDGKAIDRVMPRGAAFDP